MSVGRNNLELASIESHHFEGVNPKIGGKPPKMDGENNGKPYEQMDDLGGFPIIFGNTLEESDISISLLWPGKTSHCKNKIRS